MGDPCIAGGQTRAGDTGVWTRRQVLSSVLAPLLPCPLGAHLISGPTRVTRRPDPDAGRRTSLRCKKRAHADRLSQETKSPDTPGRFNELHREFSGRLRGASADPFYPALTLGQ
jgi:hypothetical protein